MEKSDLIEILQRPVRDCEMAHEDVRRNKVTLLPISTAYASQCKFAGQHLGCYHLLHKVLHGTYVPMDNTGILGKILIKGAHDRVLYLLETERKKLQMLDRSFRECRTSSENGPHSIIDVPLKEEADKNIKPLLTRHKSILIILEILRPRILAIVQQSA